MANSFMGSMYNVGIHIPYMEHIRYCNTVTAHFLDPGPSTPPKLIPSPPSSSVDAEMKL